MLAIRKEAFEYLGKPIKREELRLALERLSKRRVLNDGEKRSILPEPPKFDKNEDRIRLEVNRKVLFLKSDEIIYFEGDGNYCQTYLENGESIFLTQQLKSVSLLLPPQLFLRTHKSYIVNIQKIKEYHRVEHYLLLSNNKQIPVSRRLWSYFMNR